MGGLPAAIYTELFDIWRASTDIAIDHIFDELESVGFISVGYTDFDHAVVINFKSLTNDAIFGELRVDRIRKLFDISMMVDDKVVMPASGDWLLIKEYLDKAKQLI